MTCFLHFLSYCVIAPYSCYSIFYAIPRNTVLILSCSPLCTYMWNLPRCGHVLTSVIKILPATVALCCVARIFLHTPHVIIAVICLGSNEAPRYTRTCRASLEICAKRSSVLLFEMFPIPLLGSAGARAMVLICERSTREDGEWGFRL